MSKLCLALLVALLLASALSAPTTPQLRKRSFKVSRIRQHNYVPNGPAALRKAYLKFGPGDIDLIPGGEVAARVDAAIANSQPQTDVENGEVDAEPTQNDAEFVAPVSIGGQTLVMDFDTGSSDM